MQLDQLKPSAVFGVQRLTDFEQFRSNDIIGAVPRTVPLDHNAFSLFHATFSLPNARLLVQKTFSRTFEADMGADGCALVVPLCDQYYIEANGRALDHQSIALLRSHSHAKVFEPRPNNVVTLRLHSTMQTRGWADFEKGYDFFGASHQSMQYLRSVLCEITRAASDCSDPIEFADLAGSLQESLYAALDDVLVIKSAIEARPRTFDRHKHIVARLDDFMKEYPTIPLYSEDLASNLGASVRTLQTAVWSVHGMSLHQYLRLKRLWLVRRQLTRRLPGMNIRVAAQSNGFWHMGEFSRLYKTIFGELPSETVSRSGGSRLRPTGGVLRQAGSSDRELLPSAASH
jgi:AraC-like DNA-binding protein